MPLNVGSQYRRKPGPEALRLLLVSYSLLKITRKASAGSGLGKALSLQNLPSFAIATETNRPIPHHAIVQALIETLGFHHTGIVNAE